MINSHMMPYTLETKLEYNPTLLKNVYVRTHIRSILIELYIYVYSSSVPGSDRLFLISGIWCYRSYENCFRSGTNRPLSGMHGGHLFHR